MSLDLVLADLERIYGTGKPGGEVPESTRLSEKDLEKWSQLAGITRESLYDEIAMYLARGFQAKQLSFDFCDVVASHLFQSVISSLVAGREQNLPELFYDVYCAFDAGEYSTIPEEDPVETYTRPLIARIIAAVDAGLTDEERGAAIRMPSRR